ncbi:MAG: tyrosine-type recombinase/integrase [Chloroflexi bacterium]|nr:tyrosine-type recombinase/integrase [Chloroflexota bacterium]
MTTKDIVVQDEYSPLEAFIDQTLGIPSPQAGYSVLSAKNYSGAAKQLLHFMRETHALQPDKVTLERWRDVMLADGKSVRTVNAKLSAARKLIRTMSDHADNPEFQMTAERWCSVKDAKQTALADEDKTEADYGKRFALDAAKRLIKSPDINHLKGLRDRALIAVMLGAGLRVSEVANLTMSDVFSTVNASGQQGIKVVRGKHNKTRVVVLNGWGSWVIKAVKAYTDTIGLTPLEHPTERVFRGVKIVTRAKVGKATRQGTTYSSAGDKITPRNIEDAVSSYTAEYNGQQVSVACHDLRRTYAKISKQSGMSWEALRANMGHSSVTITEAYVGKDVDWSERVPNWTINID